METKSEKLQRQIDNLLCWFNKGRKELNKTSMSYEDTIEDLSGVHNLMHAQYLAKELVETLALMASNKAIKEMGS